MFAAEDSTHWTITKMCASPIRTVPTMFRPPSEMFGDPIASFNLPKTFLPSSELRKYPSVGMTDRWIRSRCSGWSSFCSFERDTIDKNKIRSEAHCTLFSFLLKRGQKRKLSESKRSLNVLRSFPLQFVSRPVRWLRLKSFCKKGQNQFPKLFRILVA